MSIQENIAVIKERINAACQRCGRDPSSIIIVAVTKTVPVDKILEARGYGITIIGENRIQEAWNKYQKLGKTDLHWHMVGHLQTNKVKRALEFMEVIQSVDSLHLAIAVNQAAMKMNKIQPVFLQVNTSGEASKFGIPPAQAGELARQISTMDHLQLKGLMTIGALTSDIQRIRACFKTLRKLKESLVAHGLSIQHLSMGMSDDFEIAIEEGATMLRIGRAIFGERN